MCHVSNLIRQVEIENLGSCRLTQSEYIDLSAGNNNEQHDVLSVGEKLEETMVSSLGLFPSEEVDTFRDAIGSI